MSAYIICPMTVPMRYLERVAEEVEKIIGRPPRLWNRYSNYTGQSLKKSRVAILIAENNKFDNIVVKDQPAGTRSELERCIADRKPIFLAYKLRSTTEIKLYNVRIRKVLYNTTGIQWVIDGIKGSSEVATTRLLEVLTCKKSQVTDFAGFPERRVQEWFF